MTSNTKTLLGLITLGAAVAISPLILPSKPIEEKITYPIVSRIDLGDGKKNYVIRNSDNFELILVPTDYGYRPMNSFLFEHRPPQNYTGK